MAFIEKGTWEIYQEITSLKKDISDFFEVDELIAPTIAILNKKNYETEYCCSGHIFESLIGITLMPGSKGEIDGVSFDIKEDGEALDLDVVQDVSDVYISFSKRYDFPSLPCDFYYDDYEDKTVIRKELKTPAKTFERAEELVKVARELSIWADGLNVCYNNLTKDI